jgi:hypothetical protein
MRTCYKIHAATQTHVITTSKPFDRSTAMLHSECIPKGRLRVALTVTVTKSSIACQRGCRTRDCFLSACNKKCTILRRGMRLQRRKKEHHMSVDELDTRISRGELTWVLAPFAIHTQLGDKLLFGFHLLLRSAIVHPCEIRDKAV